MTDAPTPPAAQTRGPETLAAVRRAFSDVIARLDRVTTAAQLAERLGLDRSLAWKVWRVASGNDQLPSPKHIPGPAGVRIFLDACERAGIEREIAVAAQRAHDAYRQFMTTEASDRASAEILLGGFTREGSQRLEMALRREAFRANTLFVGVQATAIYQMTVVLPPEPGQMPDLALVRGHFGLRRMRAGAGWLLSRTTLLQGSGPDRAHRRVRLDDTTGDVAGDGGVPVVPRFCSHPLPDVARRLLANASVEDELLPGPMGGSGATDIVMGERVTGIPFEPIREDAATMHVRTPCELVCFDVLIHERASREPSPRLEFYTLMSGGDLPFADPHKRDLRPMPEPLEDLGRADAAPAPPGVPQYREMVHWTATRCRVEENSLRVYRVRMKFPPLPLCMVMAYSLA